MISSLSNPLRQLKRLVRCGVLAALHMCLATSLMLSTPAALAEVPQVVTDIPATHSLVSMVMGDLGEPTLLMQGSASPHDYALKPSEASTLSKADVVVWISSDLTPWLPRAMRSLSTDTKSIELLTSPNTLTLAFRDSDEFSTHKHDSPDDEDTHHAHEHGTTDPHAWLDPANARTWLTHIASQLAELDENNQSTYFANAIAADTQIENLTNTISNQLLPIKNKPFMVFHDSYHYFESRFGLHAIGAISLGDGSPPGIKRISDQRETLLGQPGACVFSEPQFSERLIVTITHNTDVTIGQLDPIGVLLEPGPELYSQLLAGLAESFVECLSATRTTH